MVERTRAGWGVESPDRWIEAYSPVPSVVSRAAWAGALGDFIRGALAELVPGGPAIAARDARALARISAWCVEEGIPLDVERVLDPDTVERFVAEGLRGERSAATYRSDLRRIGRRLTKTAPWEPKPDVLCRRHVARPYSANELEELREAAGRQSTAAKRTATRALIALGSGAGLDGRWSTKVTGADVELGGGGGVLVYVDDPAARAVPVLGSFEDDVVDLAHLAGGGALVGGRAMGKNRASRLAAGFESPRPGLTLSAARLRSTWLVHHLTVGTRLPELAAAAGLAGITVLSDLLAEVEPLDELDATAMLRGR